MKKTIQLIIFLFLPLLSYSQISFEDFESYNAGAFDGQWNSSEWRAGIQGTSSGTVIVDTFGYSGNKSLLFDRDANGSRIDLLGQLPVTNSGIMEVSFKLYGLLRNNVVRIMSASFHTTDTVQGFGSFNDGGLGDVSYEAPQAFVSSSLSIKFFQGVSSQWTDHRFVFNFDIDSSYYYHQDSLVLQWQLSERKSWQLPITQIQSVLFSTVFFGMKAYIDDVRVLNYPVSTKSQPSLFEQFKVFPNPTSGQLNIDIVLEKPMDVQYRIMDMQGRIVASWTASQVTQAQYQRDISHLANGIYLVQAIAGEQISVEKIVIAK